jgi:hypothetical protein
MMPRDGLARRWSIACRLALLVAAAVLPLHVSLSTYSCKLRMHACITHTNTHKHTHTQTRHTHRQHTQHTTPPTRSRAPQTCQHAALLVAVGSSSTLACHHTRRIRTRQFQQPRQRICRRQHLRRHTLLSPPAQRR